MESQVPQNSQTPSVALGNNNQEIEIGTSVIYGLHGRCTVTGVETRSLGGDTQRFYKLEKQKSPLSRSTRQEPAIWLPVSSANSRGLRSPMNQTDVDTAFQIFSSREYYFSLKDQWNVAQEKIEAAIRTEGSTGMAKALSFLFVLKKRQVVASSEVTKLSEAIQKNFNREVTEITGETAKQIEDKMNKAMKSKLLADQ
jgi:RNA polymerase-interacting CarD/CdnL/TRCF family regulator